MPGGHVAVARTPVNVPDGPGVLATTICVEASPPSTQIAYDQVLTALAA
jgi:hypothetical protein